MASEEEIDENSMYLWKLISRYSKDYVNKEDYAKTITDLIDSENIDINRSYGVNNSTPLYLASYFGMENIVNKLIEKGAEIDNQDRGGDTPLFAAALNGHLNIVKMLLEKGANRKITNNDGQTPHDIAKKMLIDTKDNKYSIISKRIIDYYNKKSSESNTLEKNVTRGSYEKETPDAILREKETPDAILREKETPYATTTEDGFTYNPLHKATRKNVLYNNWLNTPKGINTNEKTSRKGGKNRRQKTRRRRNKKSHKKRR
jgi:hypothetical protein